MRPWILDLVRIAKYSLDDALKGLGSKADPLGAYTSQDVPGLGLCMVLGKDILKGQKAYSAMLRKYALHVRLITINYIDSHAFLPHPRFFTAYSCLIATTGPPLPLGEDKGQRVKG